MDFRDLSALIKIAKFWGLMEKPFIETYERWKVTKILKSKDNYIYGP